MIRIALLQPTVLGGRKLLPFSDNFDRADGDLGNGWEYTAGKWTINTNKALGTPGLGANLVVNGTFDADSNWTKGTGWTIPTPVASRDGTTGGSALYQPDIAVLARWYHNTFDIVSHNSGGGFNIHNGTVIHYSYYSTTIGTEEMQGRSSNDDLLIGSNNGENGTIDNVTCKQITLADMFATRDLGSRNVDARAAVTCRMNSHAGLVIGLDDKDNPGSFLLAYIGRGGMGNRAYLDKCVGGVYTNLINVQLAGDYVYINGRILRVVKSGADVSLYYHGTQMSTTKTLTSPADNAIINSKRHGLFTSEGGTNRLDDFFCS
jgi:hypothetical protein